MIIKLLYSLAIGILVATFVGIGVNTFYPPPQLDDELSSPYQKQDDAAVQKYNERWTEWSNEQKQHSQTASLIVVGISIALLALCIIKIGRIEVIGEGVTLGGIFLLFYGVMLGLTTGDEMLRFWLVSVGLAVMIALTYWKFHRIDKKTA